MKRMRGRQNRGGPGNGGGPTPIRHQGGNIPLNRNHSFDSSGPDVRVRGTAQQLFEKYLQLGRDATSGGDRVMAESYFQHAEHYFRIINAMNQAVQQTQGVGQQQGGQRRYGDSDSGGESGDDQGQDERPDPRQDNRSRGNDGEEGQMRAPPHNEARGEARVEARPEPRSEHRPPGTGDQPDAREIPISAAPPEG